METKAKTICTKNIRKEMERGGKVEREMGHDKEKKEMKTENCQNGYCKKIVIYKKEENRNETL